MRLEGGHQDSADKEFHMIIGNTSVEEVPVPALKMLNTKATIGLADVCVREDSSNKRYSCCCKQKAISQRSQEI